MKQFNKSALSILISFLLCFSSVAAFGMEPMVSSDTEIAEAMEVLRLFEIIPDYYDYNTNFNENVSRADFADAAAKLINYAEYHGDSVYYYDVPKNHYAYESISVLTEMGILGGVSEKLFKPDEFIEPAAAYKIILSLLGYNVRAENDGGYPNGYLKMASRLKLDFDMSDTQYLTRHDMLILLYRSLTTKMLITVSYSKDNYNKYSVSKEDTLLSMYRNIVIETGVVDGANKVSLSGKELGENDVIIGNTVYNTNIPLFEYLGEEVDAYVLKESNTHKGTVLWVKRTGNTKILEVSGDDFSDFDKTSYVFSYFNGNNKQKITLDRSAVIIFNGAEITKNVSDILSRNNYTYKFVKNGGKYKTAIVKSYENYVADKVNLTDMVVYDKVNPQKFLKIDENLYDYFSVKTSEGTEMPLEQITEGSVLSAFMSADKKCLEIIVSNATMSGELNSISTTSAETQLVIEKTEYMVPKNIDIKSMRPGATVTVYLDFSGKVAYADIAKTLDFVGYVIEQKHSKSGLNEELQLRILTDEGSVKIFTCIDNVKVDGLKTKKVSEAAAAFLKDGAFAPQLAAFKLNSEGLISEIDTAYVRAEVESENNSLSENRPYGKRLWKSGALSLGYDMAIDDQTLFFALPDKADITAAEDKEFGVSNRYIMSNDEFYYVESYKMTERPECEKYVLIYDQSGMSMSWDRTLPVLVESIGTALNSDEAVVECIYGIQGGNEVVLLSDGEYLFSQHGIKQGMLLGLNASLSGEVSDTRVIFDFANLGTYGINKSTQDAERWKTYGIEIGYVKDVVGDVIYVCMDDAEDATETASGEADRIVSRNNKPVVIYDTRKERDFMKVGSFSDANTWVNVGNNCSAAVIVYDYGVPVLFVIYNR